MPRRERPLDPGQGLVVEFARDLRRLRESAGRPTYRELSARAHYSTSALSEAAAGRKLPSLAVTVAFVSACGGDIEAWESRWRGDAAELAGPVLAVGDDSDAPYAGLAAFQRGDADRFFGRDRLVDDVVARVQNRRMVAVFGASGCGKSSVLMAGLLPRWQPDRGQCRAVVFTPGPHPLEECAVRLAALAGRSAAAMKAEFAADPGNLHLCVRQILADEPTDDFLLLVDQFEELFTVCADPAERAAFVGALTIAATTPTSRTRVVLGIRADFYGRCGDYPDLVDGLRDGQVLVGAMTSDELRVAVTGPAEAVGCRVETALVSRLVADATGQPAALPLVSHALRETWRRRQGAVLTLAAYEATGGIHHALARTADTVYGELSIDQRRVARQLFLRLIAPGEGTEDTKRRVRRDEIDERPATLEVLEKLAAARLVAVDRDRIEIAHEALIRHWPRLRGWLDDDREVLRAHRQLIQATEVWEAHDQDRGSLLRGARLTTAEKLAAGEQVAFTDREFAFVRASVAARTDEQLAARRRVRRIRQLVALLAVLLLVACGSLLSSVRAQHAVTEQRNAAIVGGVLRDADFARDTNPALSLQLTLAAYRTEPSRRTRDALLATLASPYASRIEGPGRSISNVVVSGNGNLLIAMGERASRLWDITDPHHPRALPPLLPGSLAAAFGPRHALVLATQNSIQVWDLQDPRRPRLVALSNTASRDRPNLSSAVAYRGDGRTVVTADGTGMTQLWDLTDIAQPRQRALITTGWPRSGLDANASVAFGRGGDLLAVASATAHSVQLWDVTDPGRPRLLTTAPGDYVAFAPDGRSLAVAGRRGSVQLWDVADPQRPRTLATMTNPVGVVSMAFEPGMRLFATGDVNGTVRLWDVTDSRQPVPLTDLPGHTNAIQSTAFGADGNVLVTADADAVTRVWDLSSTLIHHNDAVTVATVDHGGDLLVTGGRDHTARLWQIDGDHSRHLTTLDSAFTPSAASFSPDDRTLVLAGYQGSTQVWDLTHHTDPVPAGTLPRANTPISTSFGTKYGTLVISQADRHTRLYDLADPHQPHEVDELAPYALEAVAFRPGSRLLAATYGGYTDIWDVDAPFTSRNLTSKTAIDGTAVGFSPDGHVLVIFSYRSRDVQLWSVTDPRKPELLSTLESDVSEQLLSSGPPPTFAADGRTIAIADGGRTVRVFDIANPRHPKNMVALDFGRQVESLSISPDGHHLFAAAEENVVLHRYIDIEDVVARICAIAYPRISTTEWRKYLPNLPYQPPCR